MMNLSFAQPWFFLFLFILIPMFYYEKKTRVAIGFSSFQNFPKKNFSFNFIFFLRNITVILFIVALARPQLGRVKGERKTEGLDIILALDTSGSMKALDLKLKGRPAQRLSVIKSVVEDFIDKRLDDRLGLVIFGSQAYAQSPLTLDHDVLKTHLQGLEIGIAGEQTAIGDALGVAINSIKDVKAKSRIIILLTDGENTAGKHDPLQMVAVAKSIGVKIYTIGVGSDRPVPVQTSFGVQYYPVSLDEGLLKKIAQETDARYYRAENTETLVKVYEAIDKLEKSELKIKSYRLYDEKFSVILWLALFAFFAEIIISLTPLRRIP